MLLFLSENVSDTVDILRKNGFQVDYKPKPEDPEDPNGYVVDKNDPNKIFAIISSVIRWRKAMPDWYLPEKAKSCIQTTNSKKEQKLIKKIKKLFSIIEECEEIKRKRRTTL